MTEQTLQIKNGPSSLLRALPVYKRFYFSVKSTTELIETVKWIQNTDLQSCRAQLDVEQNFTADLRKWREAVASVKECLNGNDKFCDINIHLSTSNVHVLDAFGKIELAYNLDICLRKPRGTNMPTNRFDAASFLFPVAQDSRQKITCRVFANGLTTAVLSSFIQEAETVGIQGSFLENTPLPLIVTASRKSAFWHFNLGFRFLQLVDFTCICESRTICGAQIGKYFSWVYRLKEPELPVVFRTRATNYLSYFYLEECTEAVPVKLELSRVTVYDLSYLKIHAMRKARFESVELRTREYKKWKYGLAFTDIIRKFMVTRTSLVRKRKNCRASLEIPTFISAHADILEIAS